jgi:hypothetical protein
MRVFRKIRLDGHGQAENHERDELFFPGPKNPPSRRRSFPAKALRERGKAFARRKP